jgi:hypothetical protein
VNKTIKEALIELSNFLAQEGETEPFEIALPERSYMLLYGQTAETATFWPLKRLPTVTESDAPIIFVETINGSVVVTRRAIAKTQHQT